MPLSIKMELKNRFLSLHNKKKEVRGFYSRLMRFTLLVFHACNLARGWWRWRMRLCKNLFFLRRYLEESRTKWKQISFHIIESLPYNFTLCGFVCLSLTDWLIRRQWKESEVALIKIHFAITFVIHSTATFLHRGRFRWCYWIENFFIYATMNERQFIHKTW